MLGMLRKVREYFDRVSDPIVSRDVALCDYLMSGIAVFSLKIPSLLKFDGLARLNKSSAQARNLNAQPVPEFRHSELAALLSHLVGEVEEVRTRRSVHRRTITDEDTLERHPAFHRSFSSRAAA